MKSVFNKHFTDINILSKISSLLFVVIFASVATVYIIGAHASQIPPAYNINLTTKDTTDTPISGVFVLVSSFTQNQNGNSMNTCTDLQGEISNPNIIVGCQSISGNATVQSISLTGYHVCACSPVQVGSSFSPAASENGPEFGTIIMEANPAPPPTPSPPPVITKPAPPKSSGSTKKTTTPAPATPSTGSSTQAAPATTDLQPTTGTSDDIQDNTYTNVPKGIDTVIDSSDNQVGVTFLKGTFNTDAYCTVDSVDKSSVPVKSGQLIGPYSIDCTDSNGNALNNFKKAVTVSMTLPSNNNHYIAYASSTKWGQVSSSQKPRNISFKLAKAQLFATAPKKSTNWGVIAIDMVAIIIFMLVVGLMAYLIRRRQYIDGPPMGSTGTN